MPTFRERFIKNLFQITPASFEEHALALFQYQATHNPIYKKYMAYLHLDIHHIKHSSQIPFLPIDFFKHHTIKTGDWKETHLFESSGTTGESVSKHFVRDIHLYRKNTVAIRDFFYKNIRNSIILALLPSYLERPHSSLIDMLRYWMEKSQHATHAFYIDNEKALFEKLVFCKKNKQPVMLWGVTFALLDFGNTYPFELDSESIIVETGGMKGRKKELTREEVHTQLKKSFQVSSIHSEYGMTELFSQGYAKEDGVFQTPPWMKILIREINDPLTVVEKTKRGGINIIDLANVDTCAFIETQDIGEITKNGFRVLGRIDHSDLRGCNLMSI